MSQPAQVGRSVPRRDGPEKATGAARYTADLTVPGALYGRAVRSTYPHARIVRVDAAQALAVPGVVAVLTAEDMLRWGISPFYGSLVRDQPIVAVDRVRYVGDVVAAVAAESEEAAAEAAERIAVEYEPLPAVLTIEDALAPGAPLLHEAAGGGRVGQGDTVGVSAEPGTNVTGRFRLRKGDADAAFAAADVVLEHTFRLPPVSHAQLEPHAALAAVAADGSIDVWTATQTPSAVRQDLADVFGEPLSRVRVRVPLVGGGFGAKCYLKIEPLAVALARKTGRPVKLVLTQEESFLTITRHGARVRVASALNRTGDILARHLDIAYDAGAYADVSPRVTRNGAYPGAGPYRIPNVHVDAYSVYTNKVPAGAYRGYGVSQVCWAVESHTDLLAEAVGLDPLAFRLRNAWRQGDLTHNGQPVHGSTLSGLLEAAAGGVGWTEDRRRARASEGPPKGRFRGRGIACAVKGTSPTVSHATLKMNEDGSLEVIVGTVEIGQGSETALAQIAAEALALPLDRVRVVRPDTAVTPYDRSTSSSRSVFMMGNAILQAAGDLRAQLLDAAAGMLEASPADLTLDAGAVAVRGIPGRRLPYADVLAYRFGARSGNLVGRGAEQRRGGLDPDNGQGVISPFWELSAAGCEVEVDAETGEVFVRRYVAVVDVGRAINPLLCEGQLEGGVAGGLGPTLGEELRFTDGQPVNARIIDYPLPTARQMPEELRSVLFEHPAPDGPFGAHGVGEAPIMPVAPAVANAVADAVGVRIHELPITPEKVLRALQGA